ncbi:MAG: hypothetical protein ABL962_02595 [Fimbriimonadaceae bacterium]
MSDAVQISLSKSEALVLYEFFARFQESDEFVMRTNAEFVAFSSVSGQLDKAVDVMFNTNYNERLEAATQEIAGNYEGTAPGVMPLPS